VRSVVADTGPVNYLLLIRHIDVLPLLFEKVILPASVRNELKHPKAPETVRQWIADPPAWIEVHEAVNPHDPALADLDAGEEEAIILAVELHADMVLMDDREGVIAARSRGFRVAGTLGILSMAASQGFVDLADAFARLKRTNFHYQQEIMDQLLADSSGRHLS
jgi:predicted nucleic acid-binding protein